MPTPMGNNLNIGRFNTFIDNANSLLACDEACQLNKQEIKLKEAVSNAEINLATAPTQLETSNRDYIIYTQGEATYNLYVTNTLTAEAQTRSQGFSTDFNTAADDTINLINSYSALENNIDHVSEYYNSLVEENKVLKLQLKNKFSDVVTNDRKTFYEDQKIQSLYYYYKIILFIYFIACVSFAIFIVIYPSENGRRAKIVALIIFIIYPFVCTRFFLFLGTVYDNVASLMPKNVYKNPQAAYSPNETVSG